MTDEKTKRSLVLGAYPAIQCPVRTHYAFDPSVTGATTPISPELQEVIDAGKAFEAELFAQITSAAPDRFHLVEAETYRDAIDETLAAMERGVAVILGGTLPDDAIGHRCGRPDLLIRHGDSLPATYLPGDVKLHRFIERKASNSKHSYAITVAPASNPHARVQLTDARPRSTRLEDNSLQLVHYTRLLEALGRHPGPDHYEAFLVSGDEWVDSWSLPEVHGTWIALDEPAFTTYSRSEGRKTRSALERYDHEFGFRLTVAQNAAAGNSPIVVPIYTSECDQCDWYALCEPTFAADPTTSFGSWRPNLREWLALRTLGVHTVDELATLDVTPEWLEQYQAETGDRSANARKRIALTVEKAKIAVAGHDLAFRTDVVLPPSADVEIDLDMENDTDSRVFLWGARLRRAGKASFHAFIEWSRLDDESEAALATRLTDWLGEQRDSAIAAGETIRVYHHGPVERQKLNGILGPSAVADTGIEFFDTCAWAEKHLISAAGHGLKPLASGLGFEWRDDDPGGRNCQLWLDEARTTPDPQLRDALHERVLAYNEDDTAATAWIRDHASELPTLAALEAQ